MDEFKSFKTKARLPIKLDGVEMAKMAKRLAALQKEKMEQLSIYTGHRKLHHIRMKELEEHRHRLYKCVHDGIEEREVECEQVLNFATSTVKYLELKTKKLIHERPMTDEEKQMDMFEGYPDPEKEKCRHQKCKKCGEKWFGGEHKALCHNCRKLDEYRFARES